MRHQVRRRWWVHLQGEVYSNGPFEAPSYKAALKWVRDWLGVDRLPPGTQVYEQVGPTWWELEKR